MQLSEIKDVVRATLGKRDLEPVLLDYIIASGRREIEKENNWYYMRRTKDFVLEVNKQVYTLKAGGDLELTNFKNSRAMLRKHPDENRRYEVISGDLNQLELKYGTTDSWQVEEYTVDDEDGDLSLKFFPIPDLAYQMRWLYYAWTENPTSDTGTDELISRWPELLIYSSVAQGYRIITKEEELAGPWDAKMQTELLKLKRYDWFRMENEKNMIQPRRGPFTSARDITSGNRKIYV